MKKKSGIWLHEKITNEKFNEKKLKVGTPAHFLYFSGLFISLSIWIHNSY